MNQDDGTLSDPSVLDEANPNGEPKVEGTTSRTELEPVVTTGVPTRLW